MSDLVALAKLRAASAELAAYPNTYKYFFGVFSDTVGKAQLPGLFAVAVPEMSLYPVFPTLPSAGNDSDIGKAKLRVLVGDVGDKPAFQSFLYYVISKL